jgi:hypothetical protein
LQALKLSAYEISGLAIILWATEVATAEGIQEFFHFLQTACNPSEETVLYMVKRTTADLTIKRTKEEYDQ